MKSHPARRAPELIAIASILLLAASCSRETPVVAIGSGGSLGNYYATATAIARVVNQRQEANGFRVQAIQTEGSVANIEAILSGGSQLGLAQADVTHRAVSGLGDWEAQGPAAELRAVLSLYTEAVTVVATPASNIRTTRDLIGKRIDIGHPGSGVHRNAVDVLDALGTDWRTGTTVHEEPPDTRSQMYLDGQLDAFFLTVGHPTTELEFAVHSVPGARLVALDGVAELVAEHAYYMATAVPVALYPGIENEAGVETVGIRTLLLTSSAVPDAVVHAVVRAVFEGVASLGKFDPVLKGLSPEEMVEVGATPLHPGARKYYEEAGLL
jgi:TRAP transporter TAXI family solute receptor